MTRADFRKQIPLTWTLAAPMAFSQLGQMLMGIVDTFMVGKLGPQFIGAVGLGNSIFWIAAAPATGLLMGLDYLISYSYGQRDIKACNFWLIQGTYFALVISVPLTLLIFWTAPLLEHLNLDPELAYHGKRFLQTYCWSFIPLCLFMTFKQYIQSMNRVKFITAVMVLANIVNAFFNWIFIYGHGVRPLGVAGSGVATTITRTLMLGAVIAYAFYLNKKDHLGLQEFPKKWNTKGVIKALKLGAPAGGQVALEVGVFSLSSALAGRVGIIPLAAHTIALNIASFTFMVPLGVSAASAILVGQAMGRKNLPQARLAGWSSFILGVGFMACSGIFLYFFGVPIFEIFTRDPEVIALGKKLLLLVAFFQIFDGIQVVGTGALRGMGETRFPMLANLAGHWFIGLPLGVYLCFTRSGGIIGLWVGLTLGLVVVAATVLGAWMKKISISKI